jgi:hypothetical protein
MDTNVEPKPIYAEQPIEDLVRYVVTSHKLGKYGVRAVY